jgi:K+-sensing histidine kinase KdpD
VISPPSFKHFLANRNLSPECAKAPFGLSICYGILQQQGGSISCDNNPERGATFAVELRLEKIPLLAPARRPARNSRLTG